MLCHQITVFILIFCIVRKTKTDSFQMQVLEARQLYPFRGYKDVQMFHYIVPPEVAFASFQYKANGSFQCPPKRIAVYLQYGSFPVMTLQNASYPDFFSVRRMHLHNVTLMSDMVPLTVNVSNPLPGNWYAAAFLLENTERIAQKGLFKSCLSWLSSTLKLNIVTNVISLLQNEKLKQNISGSQIYRFFALKNSWITSIELKNCLSSGRCSVMMMFRRLGMPTFTAESDSFIACNDTSPCILKVIPAVSHWNYIYIQNKEGEPLQFDLVIHTQECQDSSSLNDISEAVEVESDGLTYFDTKYETNFTSENSSCWPRIPLIRISLPTNLAYEYNLPPDKDDSYPVILNVSNTQYTLTDFEVLPIVDIGGTLVIELAVSPFMNLSHYNVSVSGCLSYGVRPSSEDVNCSSGISLNVNTSSWDNRFATRFVPYPEAGTWYFRLNTKCYIMNDTNDSIACDLPKTPVFLRIRSTPCVLGHCGNYGTCYQYVSGGLIFSTCNCIA
ncbi:post-GPI attachment to proteins factor 6-like, partial [Stegodyphus dumicola]|uniref:post-GPI attachment to proteins factor 6-like n=1 Tax=Stegodyphus dumicola TaxID=202533 RepID=UPI0015ABC4B1